MICKLLKCCRITIKSLFDFSTQLTTIFTFYIFGIIYIFSCSNHLQLLLVKLSILTLLQTTIVTPVCSHQHSELRGPVLHMLVPLLHGRLAPAQSAERFHGMRWPVRSSVGNGVMIQGCCMLELLQPAISPQLHFHEASHIS